MNKNTEVHIINAKTFYKYDIGITQIYAEVIGEELDKAVEQLVNTDLTHLNITGIPKLSFIGMQGAPSYYNVHLEEEFINQNAIFTKREQQILRYMIQGKRTEDIANEIHRSIFTIQNHRKNILQKSGCKSLQELLVKAIREGWVQLLIPIKKVIPMEGQLPSAVCTSRHYHILTMWTSKRISILFLCLQFYELAQFCTL